MDLFTAINRRYSVRQYQPKPVPDELLKQMIEAAHQAPSSWNLQPWEYVIVTDPELKRALRVAANNQAHVEEAGALIVCLGSLRQQDGLADRIESSLTGDATPARRERVTRIVSRMREDQEYRKTHVLTNTFIGISFLVLAAQGLGLGTVWMGGYDPEQVKEILAIPDEFFVAALISVGYPAEEGAQPPRQRRPVAEIQHWNGFGR